MGFGLLPGNVTVAATCPLAPALPKALKMNLPARVSRLLAPERGGPTGALGTLVLRPKAPEVWVPELSVLAPPITRVVTEPSDESLPFALALSSGRFLAIFPGRNLVTALGTPAVTSACTPSPNLVDDG